MPVRLGLTCDQSRWFRIRCIRLRLVAFAMLRRAKSYGVIEIPQLGSQIPGVASSIMCPSGSRKYKLWAPLSQFISLRRPTPCFARRARQESTASFEMPNAMCPGPRPSWWARATGWQDITTRCLVGRVRCLATDDEQIALIGHAKHAARVTGFHFAQTENPLVKMQARGSSSTKSAVSTRPFSVSLRSVSSIRSIAH